MNYIQFVNSLKDNIENGYIVKSDDMFLLNQVEEKLTQKCNIELKEFDKVVFDLENFSLQEFEESILQIPIQATRRLIVVKNLPKINESEKKSFTKIISKCGENSCVMLVCNQNGEDFSFVNTFTKIDCSRLSDDLCKKFVKDKLNKANFSIQENACVSLVELCSNNLGRIETELNKLMFLTWDKKIIEENDVKISVNVDLEYQVFEISECLVKNNALRAFLIINDMLIKKEEPTTIIAMITSYFRRLYFAKISSDDNLTLSKYLGVKEYAVKIAKDSSSKISAVSLKKINEMLLDVDYMIKSGKMPADIALFYCVTQIISLIKS